MTEKRKKEKKGNKVMSELKKSVMLTRTIVNLEKNIKKDKCLHFI